MKRAPGRKLRVMAGKLFALEAKERAMKTIKCHNPKTRSRSWRVD